MVFRSWFEDWLDRWHRDFGEMDGDLGCSMREQQLKNHVRFLSPFYINA